MSDNEFPLLVKGQWDQRRFLCVGLDADQERIPRRYFDRLSTRSGTLSFNTEIVKQTEGVAGFYKPNIAFYSGLGSWGIEVLAETNDYIRRSHRRIPIILDGKRADIGNTNRGYVREGEYFSADAVTVNPYLGEEALKPFFDSNLGLVVLCKTSNPGSGEFQDRPVLPTPEEAERWGIAEHQPIPFYELVAYRVSHEWKHRDRCALVVGATYPEQLARVRAIVGDMPILVPGIGKQGGKIDEVMENGLDKSSRGLIINSSSDIIFSDDPAWKANELDQEIRALLP